MKRLVGGCLFVMLGCGVPLDEPQQGGPASLTQAIKPDTTLQVPSEYPTINQAIAAAQAGDTVEVFEGTYSENVVLKASGVRLLGRKGAVIDGTGRKGIGILALGTATAKLTGVEISGFEVAHFENGIVVQAAIGASVHDNVAHDNVDKTPPLVLGEATGIQLGNCESCSAMDNVVYGNGEAGIEVRLGAHGCEVGFNEIYGNGVQHAVKDDLNGVGVWVTGLNTNDNLIDHNKIWGNIGRGVLVSRPAGSVPPITGTVIQFNAVHENQRSGIALMLATRLNRVEYNDARDNNLTILEPCWHCNLVDLSLGDNTWLDNHGLLSLTDDCLHP